MNESDANQWLLESATLSRARLDDHLEQTQRMPVADRRRRQAEARDMHTGILADVIAETADAIARQMDFRDGQPAQDYPTQAARRGFTDV